MKRYITKHLATLFIVISTISFVGAAAAHGHRGGDSIAMTWLIDGSSQVYQVDAPVNPPLRFVKMHFMAKAGLPLREEDDYVVEKVVVTTNVPTRDPSIILPPGAITSPPVIPVTTTTTYVPLDEDKSLKDLGIVAGDTLRLRNVPDDETGEVGLRNFGWYERDHHRDHH